ncbi:multiphosphoryl transfer protein (MTP) [Paractinoplanes deccanensis]|uniref:Phosphocarrier protein HPr n=1 Tax=Paractinoplanes deccanensis TaxID=113561 RepID=A0ABQ3Y0R3_9ACTN|nr:phosphoenolpyruvate--protein phosphotransferase [Actinoplanes deccanensis]GID73596.1 multiphosphoryl transfer protein (MTP) [Actinoplanes deccanensis]
MVGLVVVSHSRPLARAAVALAAEMTKGRPLAVEIAAGLDDLDEQTYGTDALAITEAITAADSGDGVVVLMDLGSAVLSAETALELLDDEVREKVVLCPAPLVEGLIAATVAAASGAGRDEVAAEAMAGLAGKESQLGPAPSSASPSLPQEHDGLSATVTVSHPHGLHARPAARLVAEARSFDGALVQLRNATTGSGWVPATSLSRVATLGALQGHDVEIRASGVRAREALGRVAALVVADEASLSTGAVGPTAASPGVAVGPAVHLRETPINLPDHPSLGPEPERQRLTQALDETRRAIAQIRSAEPGIFDAHLLLLDDLVPAADSLIAQGLPAPRAWQTATTDLAADFDSLTDPYQRARAADVRAVGDQVLRALIGAPAPAVTTDAPTGDDAPPAAAGGGVLIAADLTPARAALLDPSRVAGVLLAAGSPTSHAAILIRTRGLPAVVGAGPDVLDIPAGTEIALDGTAGEFAVAPPPPVLASFRERASHEAALRTAARSHASEPAVTVDGVTVAVGANIGDVGDARAAAANGADLAGLVRTEFLFQDRATAPGVDEQVAVYRRIAEALGGRRVTLRTLDAGSDKPVPYLPAPAEANPFLGVRGLRLSLLHPDVFADQLLAVVRVAREAPVSLMFPMVTTVDELRRARLLLDEAVARDGAGRPPDLRVGMMVEVPAAALRAADFVPYADFLSVGTNDLTQYTLAAERGNAALASLASGLDPAVERLVGEVCRAAGDRVPVAVCGELAADERAVPRLLAAGVRQLSVAPALVPLVKQTVRCVEVPR